MVKRKDWPAGAKPWKLERIVPYPKNARTHPPEQIELLASMLQRWGPDQPIVVDENGVILKGHGRRLAAIEAGLTDFPVVQRFGMPEAEKTGMRIADNQVSLLAGWDRELIQGEITDLKLAGYDVALLGFGTELQKWDPPPARVHPEEIPPAEPGKPVSRRGDIWQLGDHRIMCGDATEPEDWRRLFGRRKAAMVFTDPPWGVSFRKFIPKDPNRKQFAAVAIKGDEKRADDLYMMLAKSFKHMVASTADTAAFYIWHACGTREDFAQAMKAAGLREWICLIWIKPYHVISHNDYQQQYEPCFYASKSGHTPAFYGSRGEFTVWRTSLAQTKNTAATIGTGIVILDGQGGTLYIQPRAPKNKKLRQVRVADGGNVFLTEADKQNGTIWEIARDADPEHPTQKPVELARRAIENSSRPGEIVADGFAGSHSTLIAAEMTGRKAYCLEVDPVYCDVGIRRWQKFTGKAAVLEQSQETYEQVRRHRSRAPARAQRALSTANSKEHHSKDRDQDDALRSPLGSDHAPPPKRSQRDASTYSDARSSQRHDENDQPSGSRQHQLAPGKQDAGRA